MTLKLVSDNTVELPVYNFQDIVACARKWAEQLETGKQGEPFRVAVIALSDEGIAISVWGESADPHQLMGLFEAAKLQVFADSVTGDGE